VTLCPLWLISVLQELTGLRAVVVAFRGESQDENAIYRMRHRIGHAVYPKRQR
jgi:hypothetical protein